MDLLLNDAVLPENGCGGVFPIDAQHDRTRKLQPKQLVTGHRVILEILDWRLSASLVF